MAKPPRPSQSAAAPAASPVSAFPTCPPCPTPGDCQFEGQCDDKRRNAGRPTLFSDALADEIVEHIEQGGNLIRWCEGDGRPDRRTVQRWQTARPVFAASLARAREVSADALVDETLTIADSGENDTYRDSEGNVRVDSDVVQRSKLRVETRLKVAAMLNPKRYGAKLDLTTDGKPLALRTDEELTARIAELEQKRLQDAQLLAAVRGEPAL